MTIEEFNEHVSNLLKGGEVVDMTNNATTLQDDYATMLAQASENEKEIERLKEENQTLKNTNYDLLLKRGIDVKEKIPNKEENESKEHEKMSVEDYIELESKKER